MTSAGQEGGRLAALERLLADGPVADAELAIERRGGQATIAAPARLAGSVLELRPPVGCADVPLYVVLQATETPLTELGFAPASVALASWADEERASGLVVAAPQLLVAPDRLGSDHDAPVAGGRRADGRLELWIQASAQETVVATVDADRRLGQIADLEVTSGGRSHRLLVALAPHGPDRMLGFAHLPIDLDAPLTRSRVVVSPQPPADATPALMERSRRAATSDAARRALDEAALRANG